MIKAIWINDIHLEFLSDDKLRLFLFKLQQQDADCLLIGGDIAQAPSLIDCLKRIEKTMSFPICFVLGNHDYYFGSIEEVRNNIKELSYNSQYLYWLHEWDAVKLTEKTALIGHEGWGDATDAWESFINLMYSLMILN